MDPSNVSPLSFLSLQMAPLAHVSKNRPPIAKLQATTRCTKPCSLADIYIRYWILDRSQSARFHSQSEKRVKNIDIDLSNTDSQVDWSIGHWSSVVTRVGVTRGSNWRYHTDFSLKKTEDLFCSLLPLLLISIGCAPPLLEGVTPHLFYLPDLICLLFFVNSATNFFLRVSSPPGGCHAGRTASPSDATALKLWSLQVCVSL